MPIPNPGESERAFLWRQMTALTWAFMTLGALGLGWMWGHPGWATIWVAIVGWLSIDFAQRWTIERTRGSDAGQGGGS